MRAHLGVVTPLTGVPPGVVGATTPSAGTACSALTTRAGTDLAAVAGRSPRSRTGSAARSWLSVDAWADEATTVNRVISVRPMVSAAVVAATRCGLRRALAVASLRPGRPSAGRAASRGTLMHRRHDQRPEREHRHEAQAAARGDLHEAGLRPLTCRRPGQVSQDPGRGEQTAAATRSQPSPRAVPGCSCWPPSAATGATRVADRAGITAAATVTTSPAAIEIGHGPTAAGHSGPDGIRRRTRANSRSSPQPRPSPAEDAGGRARSRPTIADSSRVPGTPGRGWPRRSAAGPAPGRAG